MLLFTCSCDRCLGPGPGSGSGSGPLGFCSCVVVTVCETRKSAAGHESCNMQLNLVQDMVNIQNQCVS